jgi:hypothetical protein
MKLDKESVIEFVLIAVLAVSFFMLGYFWYLGLGKNALSQDTALYVGLATASSFAAGFLYMYIIHKIDLMTAEVYSDVLMDRIRKLNNDLRKCAEECPCAADAYITLFFAAVYAENLVKSIKS